MINLEQSLIKKIKASVAHDVAVAESEGFVPTGLATLYLLTAILDRLEEYTPHKEEALPLPVDQADNPQSLGSEPDHPAVLQKNTGMMLALFPDRATAEQLAIPGGEPVESLHITLAYLGEMEDEEPDDGLYRPHTMPEAINRVLTAVASSAQPLTGMIGGIGRFSPAETDTTPVIALVDIPGLTEFRTALVDALKQANYFVAENHGYTPHCTLAYIPRDSLMPISTVPPLQLTFDTVWLCIGDERIPFKLGQNHEEQDETQTHRDFTRMSIPRRHWDASKYIFSKRTNYREETHEEQKTHTQGNETDAALEEGANQSQGDGPLHPAEEASTGDGRSDGRCDGESGVSLTEHGGRKGDGSGKTESDGDQRKAELAAWIADLFSTMDERGSSLSPTLETAHIVYAFSDQDQTSLARKLADAHEFAQHYAYIRDMVTVGMLTQESIADSVKDALQWGHDQVASIVQTFADTMQYILAILPSDVDIAEAMAHWIERYVAYKAPQIANVAWGTGANEGTRAAITDILDALTRVGIQARHIPDNLDASRIRVRVVPGESSGDFCAEWAGKSVPLEEADKLPFFPAHPGCIHSIQVYVESGA